MQEHKIKIGLCGFQGLFEKWICEQLNDSGIIQIEQHCRNAASMIESNNNLSCVLLMMKSMADLNQLSILSQRVNWHLIAWWIGPRLADDELIRLLNAGASAILEDHHSLEEIFSAIKDITTKGFHLNDIVSDALHGYCRRNKIIRERGLAEKQFGERDRRVIELRRTGKTAREIGEILFLSKKTIDKIFCALYQKFECRNFLELNSIYDIQRLKEIQFNH